MSAPGQDWQQPQQGWPQQPQQWGQQQQRGTNGLAIASLVLGILTLFGVGSILAIIFSVVARKQIAREGGGGNGLAIAGLVLGILGLLGSILFFVLIIAGHGHTCVGNQAYCNSVDNG